MLTWINTLKGPLWLHWGEWVAVRQEQRLKEEIDAIVLVQTGGGNG